MYNFSFFKVVRITLLVKFYSKNSQFIHLWTKGEKKRLWKLWKVDLFLRERRAQRKGAQLESRFSLLSFYHGCRVMRRWRKSTRYNQTDSPIIIHAVARDFIYSIMYAQCSRGDASWNIGRKRNSARDRNCVLAMRGGREGITTTTTRTVMPDRFIGRDLFRFLDPFLLCSVCQSKIIRVYRYVVRVTPQGNQKHGEIYRLRGQRCFDVYRSCVTDPETFFYYTVIIQLTIYIIQTLNYHTYLLEKERKKLKIVVALLIIL